MMFEMQLLGFAISWQNAGGYCGCSAKLVEKSSSSQKS